MIDRSFSATGLGIKSFEDGTGVHFAPRQRVEFRCPRQHLFTLVFAHDAEMPLGWSCPRCGTEAGRSDGRQPAPQEQKSGRTHWDMLRERRSLADLETLLAERVALRAAAAPPNAA